MPQFDITDHIVHDEDGYFFTQCGGAAVSTLYDGNDSYFCEPNETPEVAEFSNKEGEKSEITFAETTDHLNSLHLAYAERHEIALRESLAKADDFLSDEMHSVFRKELDLDFRKQFSVTSKTGKEAVTEVFHSEPRARLAMLERHASDNPVFQSILSEGEFASFRNAKPFFEMLENFSKNQSVGTFGKPFSGEVITRSDKETMGEFRISDGYLTFTHREDFDRKNPRNIDPVSVFVGSGAEAKDITEFTEKVFDRLDSARERVEARDEQAREARKANYPNIVTNSFLSLSGEVKEQPNRSPDRLSQSDKQRLYALKSVAGFITEKASKVPSMITGLNRDQRLDLFATAETAGKKLSLAHRAVRAIDKVSKSISQKRDKRKGVDMEL